GRCRIAELAVLDVRRRGPRVHHAVMQVEDVHHLDAALLQHVGDDRAVAAPPHRFGAHHGRALARGEGQHGGQPLRELRAGEVVGVAAERGIAPGGVRRIRLYPASPAQFWKPLVADAVRRQARGKRIARELRPAPRAGEAAHVGDRLDAVGREQGEELLQRAGGVADRPDRGRVGGVHAIFESAAPLCMATWSVLSLLISYCGSSGLQWRGWPLYSVSAVCTFTMWPVTWPASEFQRTWSPTWNCVPIMVVSVC